MLARRPTLTGSNCQSSRDCRSPWRSRRAMLVVDEGTPCPTNTSSSIATPEQMNVWLWIGSSSRSIVALDLDERPYERPFADRAAVEIDEGLDLHVLPEVDVLNQPVRRVVGRLAAISHGRNNRRSPRRRSPPETPRCRGTSAARGTRTRGTRRRGIRTPAEPEAGVARREVNRHRICRPFRCLAGAVTRSRLESSGADDRDADAGDGQG